MRKRCASALEGSARMGNGSFPGASGGASVSPAASAASTAQAMISWDQVSCDLTSSHERPMSLTPRFSNSGASRTTRASSVVHTGVKSRGCAKRTVQWPCRALRMRMKPRSDCADTSGQGDPRRRGAWRKTMESSSISLPSRAAACSKRDGSRAGNSSRTPLLDRSTRPPTLRRLGASPGARQESTCAARGSTARPAASTVAAASFLAAASCWSCSASSAPASTCTPAASLSTHASSPDCSNSARSLQPVGSPVMPKMSPEKPVWRMARTASVPVTFGIMLSMMMAA
mmetsp:Transcript_11831/g.35075  ORF Transcript_11831/g.35075 Transcript_11831/m.35075 type:complete len:287 (+) Transcript_11831:456-1316(+)